MNKLIAWWRNRKSVAVPTISMRNGHWLALDGWVMGWGESHIEAYDSWLLNKYKGQVVRIGSKTQWLV